MLQAMDAYRVVWEMKFPRLLPYDRPHRVRIYEGTVLLACHICVWLLGVSRSEDIVGLKGSGRREEKAVGPPEPSDSATCAM